MRALERGSRAAGEGGPSRNAQQLRSWLLWLLTPAALLSTLMLYEDFADHWTLPRLLLCVGMALAAPCLGLSLVSQRRFWWALRVVSGLVALACFTLVWLIALHPPVLAQDPRLLPMQFIATLAFLLLGLPAICFTLWGHTGGKLARGDALRVTAMDRWTARLLLLLRYAMLLSLAFYVAHTLLLLLAVLPG